VCVCESEGARCVCSIASVCEGGGGGGSRCVYSVVSVSVCVCVRRGTVCTQYSKIFFFAAALERKSKSFKVFFFAVQ
jgi:hypothetical protein